MSRVGPLLFVLLLVVPIAELWVLVRVADTIGVIPALLLLLLVSVAGAWLLKQQGTATWRRMRETMRRGEMPTSEATDGALILLGGALLLTPGFLTDVVGLVLLVPPSRAAIKGVVRRSMARRVRRRFGIPEPTKPAVQEARVVKVERNRSTRSSPPDPTGPTDPTDRAPDQLPSATRRRAEDGSPDTR